MSVLVFSLGNTSKIGIANSDLDEPKFTFPSKLPKSSIQDSKSEYVGQDTEKGTLNYQNIFSKGIIQDFDCFEKLISQNYTLLKQPEDSPVIMTEFDGVLSKQRDKVAEILFEKFNTDSYYVNTNSVFTLYATGRTSGAVLYSGHECTSTVCVREGLISPKSILLNQISGQTFSKYLKDILQLRGIVDEIDENNLNDLKHNICYFVEDSEELKVKEKKEVKYTLPDKKEITIRDESYETCELFFEPRRMELEDESISEQLRKSIKSLDHIQRDEMFGNIILSGGTTLFKGFYQRLRKEIQYDCSSKVRVIAPDERKIHNFLGASFFGSLSNFDESKIKNSEYKEIGTKIIQKKCPIAYEI